MFQATISNDILMNHYIDTNVNADFHVSAHDLIPFLILKQVVGHDDWPQRISGRIIRGSASTGDFNYFHATTD